MKKYIIPIIVLILMISNLVIALYNTAINKSEAEFKKCFVVFEAITLDGKTGKGAAVIKVNRKIQTLEDLEYMKDVLIKAITRNALDKIFTLDDFGSDKRIDPNNVYIIDFKRME